MKVWVYAIGRELATNRKHPPRVLNWRRDAQRVQQKIVNARQQGVGLRQFRLSLCSRCGHCWDKLLALRFEWEG